MQVNKNIVGIAEHFTEEALKAQDGKTCPLTFEGGPAIGTAVLRYDPHLKALVSDLKIDDENVVKFLSNPNPPEE